MTIKVHYSPETGDIINAYDGNIMDVPEPYVEIQDSEWNPANINKVTDGKYVSSFDYETYLKVVSVRLRAKCRAEREKYFPEDVKDNLVVGQTYPNELLTIENYNKLVTLYRNMVSTWEPRLMALTTKQGIDDMYDSIPWPGEQEILDAIKA